MSVTLPAVRRHLRHWFHLFGAAVADFQAAHPEENVLGDIGGVVGDAFEMAGGENVVEIGRRQRGVFGHAGEQGFENLIAILVNDIVAFEHLCG